MTVPFDASDSAEIHRLDSDATKQPHSSDLGDSWGTVEDGVRVVGDYELLEKAGVGGMGVVYKALQRSTGRIVAFKTISQRRQADPKALRRFDKETELIAELSHPGIVPVFDVGEVSGRLYFAMEFIEGISLSARLRTGLLSPRQAAQIVADLADAVQHAHERGILHRDLKPSNVLLDSGGNPRIIDFGLALRLADGSELTTANAVVGTPNYMAPERATAELEKVGVASDIYSLGAILYELLVGKPPFLAASPLRTMELAVNAELTPPCRINPLVSPALSDICVRCLEKEPRHRTATAAELSRQLRTWLERESEASGTVLKTPRRAKHSLGLTAAALIAGLLALLVVSRIQLNQARQELEQLQREKSKPEPLKSRER